MLSRNAMYKACIRPFPYGQHAYSTCVAQCTCNPILDKSPHVTFQQFPLISDWWYYVALNNTAECVALAVPGPTGWAHVSPSLTQIRMQALILGVGLGPPQHCCRLGGGEGEGGRQMGPALPELGGSGEVGILGWENIVTLLFLHWTRPEPHRQHPHTLKHKHYARIHRLQELRAYYSHTQTPYHCSAYYSATVWVHCTCHRKAVEWNDLQQAD